MTFFSNKKVLVTGHTGFKGSWLCRILLLYGAEVTGYSLDPPTDPSLFSLIGLDSKIDSINGDIRDYAHLKKVFEDKQPEIVFHLAAQPIVRTSYQEPLYTYETNVMGTANLLECVRQNQSVKSVVNITTDKVYENQEWCWGYRENERLMGYDPYSNSKSCSELVTYSYDQCFLKPQGIAVSTARAGNVIGGGDFARDRIIPDCIRAVCNGEEIRVRNPYSIRPYQHVLEPLGAYLLIAKKQYEDIRYAGAYNVGPDERDCIITGELVDLFCEKWGEGAKWISDEHEGEPHEANFLKLDCSKIKRELGWEPGWRISKGIEQVCNFTKIMISGENVAEEMDHEIKEFFGVEM